MELLYRGSASPSEDATNLTYRSSVLNSQYLRHTVVGARVKRTAERQSSGGDGTGAVGDASCWTRDTRTCSFIGLTRRP